jgi:hypothetical protein
MEITKRRHRPGSAKLSYERFRYSLAAFVG